MKRVLFYINEENNGKSSDTSSILIKTLQQYTDEFDITISTNPNPRLAYNADIIFPRFEIPVKTEFLKSLSKISDECPEKLFINNPLTKLKLWEKNYLSEFLDSGLLPHTIITHDYNLAIDFFEELDSDMILKPIDSNGGKGIQRIRRGERTDNLTSIINEATIGGKKDIILQQFIKNVANYGDKRVTVFLYEPVTVGTSTRMPKKGDYICNVSSGGMVKDSPYTKQDNEIINKIIPFLKKEKITWAGVDIMGPYLGEINVSSPGCVQRKDVIYDIAQKLRNYKYDY